MRSRRRREPTKADHHNAIRHEISSRFGPDISEREINALMDQMAVAYAQYPNELALQLYRVLDQLMISHRESQGHKSMLDNIENRMNKDRHRSMGWN